MIGLRGVSVAVAGGNGLIGEAIVKAYREMEADVMVLDCNPPADVEIDLADFKQVKRFFDNLESDYLTFVNCAYPKDFVSHEKAIVNGSMIAARWMKKRRGGVVVNFSSIYGLVGPKATMYFGVPENFCNAKYSFIKSGVIGLTKYIATMFGRFNVRALAFAPGGVYDGQSGEFVKRYSRRVPLGRMAAPADIAWPVVLLSSPLCGYLTGETIAIDGGMVAQ